MNTTRLINKFTDKASWFLGSWWAVVLHTIWFTVWIIFNFDINTLTLYVSLEAIFIGIFLLMSANRAEQQRDRLQARRQTKIFSELKTDVKIDQKQTSQLTQVLNAISDLKAEIKSLKAQK